MIVVVQRKRFADIAADIADVTIIRHSSVDRQITDAVAVLDQQFTCTCFADPLADTIIAVQRSVVHGDVAKSIAVGDCYIVRAINVRRKTG